MYQIFCPAFLPPGEGGGGRRREEEGGGGWGSVVEIECLEAIGRVGEGEGMEEKE